MSTPDEVSGDLTTCTKYITVFQGPLARKNSEKYINKLYKSLKNCGDQMKQIIKQYVE